MPEDSFIAFEDLPPEVQAASRAVREESRLAAEKLEAEVERLEAKATAIRGSNEPGELEQLFSKILARTKAEGWKDDD